MARKTTSRRPAPAARPVKTSVEDKAYGIGHKAGAATRTTGIVAKSAGQGFWQGLMGR